MFSAGGTVSKIKQGDRENAFDLSANSSSPCLVFFFLKYVIAYYFLGAGLPQQVLRDHVLTYSLRNCFKDTPTHLIF